MDEIRSGVIADTAALHGDRGVSELRQLYVGQANVNRLAEHVLTVLCYTAGTAAQHVVGSRGAIGRNDFECTFATQRLAKVIYQVEKLWVNLGNIARAKVG